MKNYGMGMKSKVAMKPKEKGAKAMAAKKGMMKPKSK
jgi:hypothetical protein